MRSLRKAIVVGAAAIALVGVAGMAGAEIRNAHVLDVSLPDGSLAHIRYAGDTPPTVSFAPAPMALPMLSPASGLVAPELPFAAIDRISQALDRQAEAMFRAIEVQSSLALEGSGLTQVEVGKLPPGVQGFAMVSTMSGTGVCTRSVQYRSPGEGKPPQVVTHMSGACAADRKRPALPVTSGSTSETSGSPPTGRHPI